MERTIQLCTAAWLLRGISSIPGMMKFANNRLSYTAFSSGNFWDYQLRKLKVDAGREGLEKLLSNDEKTVIFDVPFSQVQDIHFPWYYFSAGVKLSLGGTGFRFGFDQPANTRIPTNLMDEFRESMKQISQGRQSGKAWKAVFLH